MVSEAYDTREGTVSISSICTKRSVKHSIDSSLEASKATAKFLYVLAAVARGERKRLAQEWFAAAASLNLISSTPGSRGINA